MLDKNTYLVYLKWLADNSPVTVAKFARHFGYSQETARRYYLELWAEWGWMQKTGDTWEITQTGRDGLASHKPERIRF